MGLKEILNVSDEVSTLNIWHGQAISALESFLVNVKVSIQQQQFPLLPITISYSNDAQSESIQKTAELLGYIFTQMGIPTTLCPLEDTAKLNTQLYRVGYAVVLCTPEYAAKVGKNSPIWNALDNFGKKKKNALHPLLCEGEFRDVALQIIDGHYLIRSFHAVLNQDPLVAIPALVDIVFHLSGSQGLGLLVDVLNLKETVNAKAEIEYKARFNVLQIEIQKLTIDYRLKVSLEESVQHHPMKSHLASSPFPMVKERVGVEPILEEFLSSEAKVALFFCQNKVDTLLTSVNLTEAFSKHANNIRVLTIDCGKYPGHVSWDCVRKALKVLKLKSADIEAMKQEPLVIVLNGYQDLGVYDNLWVKNALSTWANVKLLVTCQADYFKERGYLRCFLADVSNRRVEDIAVYPIPAFASLEAQMASLSITVTPDANQEVEHYPISDKRKAEYVELTRFLERLHQIWVGKDYLKRALHQNPKLFMSYAWEDDKTESGKKALARQQMYLARIAHDFKTLGFSTWLDIEQMSGNINEQMEKNIAESDGVVLIETPRYIERSQQDTNVKKEWDAIYAKSQRQADFRVFPLQYSPQTRQGNPTLTMTSFLASHANRCDFTHIDEDYLTRMAHPESGLIARWLCDTPEKKALYQNAYATFQPELQLLVGKHLIVNQGRNDVLAFDMDNRLKGYIAPFGLYTEDSSLDTRFDLVKYFGEFLNNPECKTSIILGRAGSGKSVFALSTFRQLLQPWITYQNTHQERPKWLPIYILLRNHAQHREHAILHALKQQFRLTDADIHALKQGLNHQQHILFILDGYDELGSGIRPNYTEVLKDWPQAKLLITSRPEHFDQAHRPLESLALRATDGKVFHNSVQEAHVSPFSPNEIEQYIQQYEGEKGKDTYQTLKDLPGMMVLLDNPFLLTLLLQSLPQLLTNRQHAQERNIVRADIYEAFTQTWFLQETQGRALKPETCHTFSEELAFRLFAARTISISNTIEQKALGDFFNHPYHQAAQEASPLRLSGGEYSFIHKSVYEYFVAKRLWRALSEPNRVNLWKTRMLTEERPIIDFLAELFRNEDSADKEKPLFELVTSSREPSFPETASSNAITVLNAARVSFSGKDLNHIRIAGADLSGTNLDNTNLEGASLTQVNLAGAWLQSTNFTGAHMTGVEFGEYPSLLFEESVRSCCYSHDGRWLAIATGNDAHLYEVATMSLVHIFKGHTSAVTSVSFSPNGQLFATGSGDEIKTGNYIANAKLWHLITGALIKTLEVHTEIVTCVSFSPNGKILAAGSDDSVMLWDVETGILQKTVKKQDCIRSIKSIAFSPDGKILATGDLFGNINFWDVETSMLQKTLAKSGSSFENIAFSLDQKILAAASEDEIAMLWNVETGTLIKVLNGHTDYVISVAFNSDGKILATGSWDNTAKLWDIETGALKKTLEGHTDSVNSVAFSPDGKRLITGSLDKTVKLWDVETKTPRKKLDGHTDFVTSVAFSFDQKILATGSYDGTVKFWSVDTGRQQKMLVIPQRSKDDHWITSIAFRVDGKILAMTKRYFDDAMLWNVETGMLQKSLEGHTSEATCVAFSFDGKILATGSKDKTAILWDPETGMLHKKLVGHTDYLTCVSFNSDGKLLATASEDKNIRLWEVATGILQKILEGHTALVLCVAFSSDGCHLASGSGDNTAKLWEVDRGACIKTLEGHTAPVQSVGFSPDGQRLGTASLDCTLRLWDNLNTAMPQSVTTQVTSIIISFCFHAQLEGIFLATGHNDHSVRYWQLIQVNQKSHFQLLWTTHQNALLSQNACIGGVTGLSQDNLYLLTQRGAIDKLLLLSDAAKYASSSGSSSAQRSNDEKPEVIFYTLAPRTRATKEASAKLFSDAAKKANGINNSESISRAQEQAMILEIQDLQEATNNKKDCVIS